MFFLLGWSFHLSHQLRRIKSYQVSKEIQFTSLFFFWVIKDFFFLSKQVVLNSAKAPPQQVQGRDWDGMQNPVFTLSLRLAPVKEQAAVEDFAA